MVILIGNVAAIGECYNRVKETILWDSFQTIMISIVLFLVFMQLFQEYNKNIQNNNNQFNLPQFWVHIRLLIVVTIIASSAGSIFNFVEALFCDLQDQLIANFGGDTSNKAIQTMSDLIKNQVNLVDAQQTQDTGINSFVGAGVIDFICQSVTAFVASIGVFIFKYTYTFFIAFRYMWLLMLELVSPIAIVLVIHESTRSYFFNWLKNMLICYLLIPMFLLANAFGDSIANFFMEGTENLGWASILVIVLTGVWVKIKLFLIVRQKSSQLI